MQKYIQELIDTLNQEHNDWSISELIIKDDCAIFINKKANHIIENYTITKNKNNTFNCRYNCGNTSLPAVTRKTIQQIVDYIFEA